jgi:hypothetical protein
LSGTGPFAVCANNATFTALNRVSSSGLRVSTNKVLQYHVVSPANVLAASLMEGQIVTPILSPAQTFKISLVGGAKNRCK